MGACELCTPHSRATLGADKTTSLQGLANVLSQHHLLEDGKEGKLLEQSDSNHTKCYNDEREFERRVICPSRRYINRVISLEPQYNSAG